jgi:hypothetical protein
LCYNWQKELMTVAVPNYTTLQQMNMLVPNGRSATSSYPNYK